MRRNKRESKQKKNINKEYLSNIVKSIKIPILTLDERWNTLFPESKKDSEVNALVKELNQLIKEQGGTVNKIKDMRKLKKKLMSNIVDNMGVSPNTDENRLRDKKQDANQRLIGDINSQLDDSEDRLMELPYEIKKVNQELLLISMLRCYDTIQENSDELNELTEWIEKTKTELLAKIKEREQLEVDNNALYSFMHDLVGGEVIEIFDTQLGNKE